MVDLTKPGITTVQVTVGPPTQTMPKGGVYNRMDKLLLCKGETWDSVISRILDYWDAGHPNGK